MILKRKIIANFKSDDLRDYIRFNEILDEFAKYYDLEEYQEKNWICIYGR